MSDPTRPALGPARMFSLALAPGTLWLAWHAGVYALVPWICGHGGEGRLVLASVLALAGMGTTGFLSWRIFMRVGDASTPAVTGRRFLALAGVASAFGFALVLLAGVLPMLFLGPCDR